MLKNITLTLSLSLFATHSLAASNPPANNASNPELISQMMEKYGSGFTSLEHRAIGDLIYLHLPGATMNEPIPLTLHNGIQMTYGEIIMYGGDLFGNTKKPISNCKASEQLTCFKAQFDAMAVNGYPTDKRCSNPINQVHTIRGYMTGLELDVEAARAKGVKEWDFYHEHNVAISKKMNVLTCGGSFISDFIPYGAYIKLAQVNFDHFAPDSLKAYQAGHRYALETALKGYKKNKEGQHQEALRLLELAYQQNAFANHYLTDSFSAGHMRVPRREIHNTLALPAALKLLVANLMHDEDGRNGLNVVNAEGMSFVAYGDGYLSKPEAQLQKSIMLEAMQRSADAIYDTYTDGTIPTQFAEMTLFPDYERIPQLNQTAPLFKVVRGVVLKRVDNANIYDYHWTRYWSGLVTLIQFQATP